MTLSVVIPVWRDQRAASAISALYSWAAGRNLPVEVIASGELLPRQSLEPARVVHIVPALKGRCVQAGVLASRGSAILVCDADLPVSWADLDRLVDSLVDHDVAAGSRQGPQVESSAVPLSRRYASAAFRRLASSVVGIPPEADPQCGVKAYRATAARQLFASLMVAGLAYEVEIVARAYELGLRIVHVPVSWSNRSSTISLWRDSSHMMLDLSRLGARRLGQRVGLTSAAPVKRSGRG
jgi:hypothetical protein